MNYIELFGSDIKQDVDIIKRAIDVNSNVVFVYSGPGALYDYIDSLNDKGRGLDDEYLYKFKVCYERKDLQISFATINKNEPRNINSMSALLGELDDQNPCRIVVENDDRVQLAFIMQQLIFVEYPVEKVDILIKSEARDAVKIKRYMDKVDGLLAGCEAAIDCLLKKKDKVASENEADSSAKSTMLKAIEDALSSCTAIKQQILKAKDVELKLAVAASKKAGKSVIVNCFIGEKIAPTSTELATPNNCIYKKSPDNLYHFLLDTGIEQGSEDRQFKKRENLYDVINRCFRNAQNRERVGFACPDMHIGYVAAGSKLSSYTIFDTAGPDAAGTKHAEVADRAMKQCDVAVFAIDYSKYLTSPEEAYLREIKEMFTKQNKFHSLIFALNKIDIRYNDTGSPKSFVNSVDFLKTRLAKIDSAYRDCIIFPTCALEYLNAIEAEQAGVTELMDDEKKLPIGDMKRVTSAHEDVKALAWLHTHAINLESYHGIDKVSCDVFKKDSGMLALMSYVSKVAQYMARYETVKNITFQIDVKQREIQNILDRVSLIEKLIKADKDSSGKFQYIELLGSDIEQDVDIIKRAIDVNSNVVFVYSGPGALYDYIENLNDKGRGLDDVYLYKFKVCYERKDLQISFSTITEKRPRHITSMSALLGELDGKNPCRIVVENDDRVQLAFIMQQLIFVDYPVEKVDILIKSEARDAKKIKRFMDKVDELLRGCEEAVYRLIRQKERVASDSEVDISTKSKMLKDIDDALSSCTVIRQQILKAKDMNLKLAVAASKKAGKSVIVNCFIGEQIAPTSTELATPNNCFYKKSPDGLYHFQLEGGKEQKFEKRDDIYDLIDRCFKNAQNSEGAGFACPDMHISYVSAGNNFSSYTIFDTAGPDAAGTAHAEVAKKAMDKCDVAIFAIDYSKYLTSSEEEYLHKVKEMFTRQNKFHSLIFALNKIDIRYTDADSPKSFVKSVDFLKTRLAKIDSAYSDCIIFPTCSLEYFSAIEAESAGIAELMDAEKLLPVDEMRRVKFAHRKIKSLNWLHTHATNLERYHGIDKVSCDVFKKDSGMPALMSYVSYIAQSKARHEIINNITYLIATKRNEIQSILDHVSNIEKLIDADESSISRITGIITDYEKAVKGILYSGFTESDITEIKYGKILKTYYSSASGEKGLSDPFNFIKDDCIKRQMLALDHLYKEELLVEIIINDVCDAIWGKLSKVKKASVYEIDKLFQEKDFKDIVNNLVRDRLESSMVGTRETLKLICKDVKSIVKRRHDLVKAESDICRNRLAKENILLDMPQLPAFEFDTVMPPFSSFTVDIGNIVHGVNLYNRFSELLSEDRTFHNFWKSMFGDKKEKTFTLNKDKSEFKRIFKSCHMDENIELACRRSNVSAQLKEKLQELLNNCIPRLMVRIKNAFDSVNASHKRCAERFRSAIDDRKKYKDHLDDLFEWKMNSEFIGECTRAFMDTWNSIVSDFGEYDQSAG